MLISFLLFYETVSSFLGLYLIQASKPFMTPSKKVFFNFFHSSVEERYIVLQVQVPVGHLY